SQWRPRGLFDVGWAKLIGGWCVQQLQRDGQPPNGRLTGLLQSWAEQGKTDEATVDMIERFLLGLSDEARVTAGGESSEYILDVADRYFNKVRISQEIEAAKLDIEDGNLEAAQARLTTLRRVELGV